MYCFCTAEMPIRTILAISEDVISAKGNHCSSCFFQYLWQNYDGFAQRAG